MGIKRTRRYREVFTPSTLSVASTNADRRIHDYLKGWGTVSKDGKSVLWDCWRPATKKQRDKLERHWAKNPPFSKIVFPAINSMTASGVNVTDITSIQPLSN